MTYMIDVMSFHHSLVALASIRRCRRRSNHPPGDPKHHRRSQVCTSRPELIGTYIVDIVAMTFAMPMALFPSMAVAWGGATAAGWLYSAMYLGVCSPRFSVAGLPR